MTVADPLITELFFDVFQIVIKLLLNHVDRRISSVKRLIDTRLWLWNLNIVCTSNFLPFDELIEFTNCFKNALREQAMFTF